MSRFTKMATPKLIKLISTNKLNDVESNEVKLLIQRREQKKNKKVIISETDNLNEENALLVQATFHPFKANDNKLDSIYPAFWDTNEPEYKGKFNDYIPVNRKILQNLNEKTVEVNILPWELKTKEGLNNNEMYNIVVKIKTKNVFKTRNIITFGCYLTLI